MITPLDYLDHDSLKAMIYGATFYGAGGGGSISGGLALLNELDNSVKIKLCQVSDMEPGTWSTMVAGLGSPIAMKDLNFGPLAVSAVEGMISIAKSLENRNVSYIYSGEQGGFNTMVAAYVAANLGLPLLDLDGNGRAVPELNTGLNPIYDIPLPPLILSNQAGDITVGLPKDIHDNAACETLARTVSTAYGGVGFSAWMMNQDMHTSVSVLKQISQSIEVGKIFLYNKPKDWHDLVAQLEDAGVKVRVFAEGKITNIEVKVENGFDYGKTEITANENEQKFYVDFQNENMIIWGPQNEALLVVPELIIMVNLDTMEPLSNADTAVGQHVLLLGVHAPDQWWKISGGYDCWANILKQIGYCKIGPAIQI